MSEYDGHDDYAREFERRPAGAVVLGFFGRLGEVLLAGLAFLAVGRWTFYAMEPSRDWSGLVALIVGAGAGTVTALIAFVALASTRESDGPLRIGVRFAIIVVCLLAFALPVARAA